MKTAPAESGAAVGQSLAEWLRRNNPRQPVDVPAYASDQIDPGQDFVGIAAEADALAYLIASVDLKPPLAVGLFGAWGSGKSFLMRAVQSRIDMFHELVKDTDQRVSPVWKQIKQIKFNAWEYVQGDLWAGLLERIFRELGTVPRMESLVGSYRAPLLLEIAAENNHAETATKRVAELKKEEPAKKAALQGALEAARRVRMDTDTEAQRRRTESLKKALAKVWGEQRVRLLGSDLAELLDAATQAKAEIQRESSLFGPYLRRPRHIAVLTIGAFLIPGVALLLLKVANIPPLVSALAGLATVVPVATTAIRAATNWSRECYTELEKQEQEVQESVDEANQQVAVAQRELDEIQKNIEKLEGEAEVARMRKQELEAQVAELTPERVFSQFAEERSTYYRRRLGLLSIVRQDLSEVEREIQNNNADLLQPDSPHQSSKPNRIVLYIDDLDRCPPRKVVEVLEAVHLLLAFELFVVVVAVDSRWLSSALTEQLSALHEGGASSGQATPQDYLEKIFQLPFWIQPLTTPARQQLVRGLLAGSVRSSDSGESDDSDKTGLSLGHKEAESIEAMLGRQGSALRLEANQLSLSPEDLRFIESLAPLLGATPRRVKRFVNTCQFLLAIRPPLQSEGVCSERRIVCFLAAVNEGLPSLGNELFAAINSGASETLDSYLAVSAVQTNGEQIALKAWLDLNAEWKTVPISKLATRLETVRRLTFLQPAGKNMRNAPN